MKVWKIYITDSILSEGLYKIVSINNQKLLVFENGSIYRIKNNGDLKLNKNIVNTTCGYNVIACNGKNIKRHRVIGYAFLGLDIENQKQIIDHIDNCNIKNNLNNLMIVTKQQNSFNTKAKGYYYNKEKNKYHVQIGLNFKTLHLGYFNSTDEAHQAYLNAKLIYHII